MRIKLFGVLAILIATSLVASAQTPTAEQLNALKGMSQDQQDALLQSVLGGKGDANGATKIDSQLKMPQTVQPKSGQTDLLRQYQKDKTEDGRTLRMTDEDPELRADDTVLIDLTPVKLREKALQNSNSNKNSAADTTDMSALNGAVDGGNQGANRGDTNGQARNKPAYPNQNNYDYGRYKEKEDEQTGDDQARSEKERKKAEQMRELILRNNPYHLNRFGVLELPGLPAIPLAGLTADEATNRLSADPDLRYFDVKLTLLRLKPMGDEALKPFGYDLFEGVPSTFAPVSDIQVPLDYLVGPGDTLNLIVYGNGSATYTLTVGRDGRINFPKLGPIMVSGMTFDRARAVIEQQVQQQLIGSRVSVTMNNLRSIRVFVLGEAEKPGSYTVSGLSTMTNALFVSGGVKKIGSLRNIELKRAGRVVTVLDLYDLLLHGDTSRDMQLMPGDVIFIPPIGATVSVYGAVHRPAIYELKNEKDASQLIELAGGLTPDADQKLLQLERIQPSQLRRMVDVDLTSAAGRATVVGNGDKLRVPIIRPTLEDSVVLSGYVFRPGSFEYHPGLRLSDLISSFDELRPNADRRYIMIRREIPPEEKIEVISANLETALAARGSPADPELRPRDRITVFDLSASRERIVAPLIRELELQATPDQPAQVVTVDGRVKAPGRYPLQPDMHVSDLIRAGGSLEDSAFVGDAELTRYEIVNGSARQTDLIEINLNAIRHGDKSADLRLQPYDVLIVKVTPQWQEPGTIELAGEVRFPGKYPIDRGETLSSILRRAGGFTDLAFPGGAIYIREELKKREKDQMDLLANRLQSDLTALSLEAISSATLTSNANGGASAAQALTIGQQLMMQLRQLKPVGRLVIDLDHVTKGRPGANGDVVVRDGDRLLVPKQSQEITILGEVQSPISHVYQKGLTRDDYIAKSGGVTQKADWKRIYVVRANGDVVSGSRRGWFRRSQSTEMRPGDTIIVPLDTERVRALPLWQAVTTIIYNLTLGIYAIRHF